jgi:hypothetical protein
MQEQKPPRKSARSFAFQHSNRQIGVLVRAEHEGAAMIAAPSSAATAPTKGTLSRDGGMARELPSQFSRHDPETRRR